jgi:hypothetical protein
MVVVSISTFIAAAVPACGSLALAGSNHWYTFWATDFFVAFQKLISSRLCQTLYFVNRSRRLDRDAIPSYSPVGARSRTFSKTESRSC